MTIARRQRQRSAFLASSTTTESQKSSFRRIAFLTGLFFVLVVFFCVHRLAPRTPPARYSGTERLFSSPGDIPTELIASLDAILVLGGGRPKSIDHPPVYVERRCDDAVEVVRRRFGDESSEQKLGGNRRQREQQQRLPILCLSAGTAHLPQLLSADGLPIWESTACAAYILSKSTDGGNKSSSGATMIPPESIYVETSSYDTIGNAYFARTTHTEFNGWRKLLIVTNEFHMARTKKIFDWIYSAPAATTTRATKTTSTNPGEGYDLYYLESPNAGMTSEVVEARKEREASSSKSVDFLSKKHSTLLDVYRFLTQEHALYEAKKLVDRGHATIADVEEGSVKDSVKRSYGAR